MIIIKTILWLLLVIGLAPLVSGLITKVKNNLRLRQGQGLLQPYRNLWKLFGKEEIVPENSSWIFRATPFIVFATSVAAVFFLSGDLLTVIFILALGRFFLALAALDAGSAFGGIGSSRRNVHLQFCRARRLSGYLYPLFNARRSLVGRSPVGRARPAPSSSWRKPPACRSTTRKRTWN